MIYTMNAERVARIAKYFADAVHKKSFPDKKFSTTFHFCNEALFPEKKVSLRRGKL